MYLGKCSILVLFRILACYYCITDVDFKYGLFSQKKEEQAGAELGQAQLKLGLDLNSNYLN